MKTMNYWFVHFLKFERISREITGNSMIIKHSFVNKPPITTHNEGTFSQKFSSNSEATASELLENL